MWPPTTGGRGSVWSRSRWLTSARAASHRAGFPEVNLRTYVPADGAPGVYFFNLDADDRLSVTLARQLFQLSDYQASMQVRTDGDSVEFRSRRTSSRARPADSTPPTSRLSRRRHPNRARSSVPGGAVPLLCRERRRDGVHRRHRPRPVAASARAGRYSDERPVRRVGVRQARRRPARSLLRRDTGDCGAAPPARRGRPSLISVSPPMTVWSPSVRAGHVRRRVLRHWPVSEAAVRAAVPDWLTVETADGDAGCRPSWRLSTASRRWFEVAGPSSCSRFGPTSAAQPVSAGFACSGCR